MEQLHFSKTALAQSSSTCKSPLFIYLFLKCRKVLFGPLTGVYEITEVILDFSDEIIFIFNIESNSAIFLMLAIRCNSVGDLL